jgi:hypothetical protein
MKYKIGDILDSGYTVFQIIEIIPLTSTNQFIYKTKEEILLRDLNDNNEIRFFDWYVDTLELITQEKLIGLI